MAKASEIFQSIETRLILSSGLLQVLQAVIAIIKIPLIIRYCGVTNLGVYSTALALWQFFAFFGDSQKTSSRLSIAFKKNERAIDPRFGLALITFTLILVSILFFSNVIDKSLYVVLVLSLSAAAVYSLTAKYQGMLEGLDEIVLSNRITIFVHLIGFGFFVVLLPIGNIILLISFSFIAYIIPGVLCKIHLTRSNKLLKSTRSEKQSSKSFQLAILILAERASFCLDPLIFAVRLGNYEVGNFSIYQKFIILFSIFPVALIPHLSTAFGKINPEKILRTSIRYICFANFCILFVIIFAKDYYFELISDGRLQINDTILIFAVINGVVGSLAVPLIQSSSISGRLRVRVFVTVITTVVSLIVTWVLCPTFGIAISFITSTISTAVIFAAISTLKRSN